MALVIKESRRFIVNLLADFIIEKLGKASTSKIQIVDCENFFVVKGKTNNKEILDLSVVIPEFSNKFKEYLDDKKLINTIDLIEYDCKLEDVNKLELSLYDSINCSYSKKEIEIYNQTNEISEDDLVYVSEFPHGYALNQGRLLYYYLKKIFYSFPSNYIAKDITFKIDAAETHEKKIIVYNNLQEEFDEVLKSAILDHVDFNTKKLETYMISSDWYCELITPLEDHGCLKNEGFGIVIV